MFSICNGILAFLAKTSVFKCSSLSESKLGVQISTNLTQTKASVMDEVDGDYNHLPQVDEKKQKILTKIKLESKKRKMGL
ncbi:hypothetical protein DITRI_Ditri13aG0109500 [Diplodiscus trichospermus]